MTESVDLPGGGTVLLAWSSALETFTVRATLNGQVLWQEGTTAKELPTIAALRAVLLGHRVCIPGDVADRLIAIQNECGSAF
ncbi:hypothetical protein Ppa06_57690 [Planomonospora parontospora subsp. parontospora]|uniref:Uncharacterized protein n=2 Tax=Planomonospora parontospora TaxID=58119 RepID=A0AA37BLJ8_9ACTN|nr:hypothetical protein [Planomonospora parontospora]GGK90672.1 hypothetical protein GCM10010126_57620 [Planomonospora parontospora]GII11971.1 hypothetical protein Ppa06_57690 [Planomonospora parontospora subsp. parontospora]